MTAEPQLTFDLETAAGEVSPQELATLIQILGSGQWHTAANLAQDPRLIQLHPEISQANLIRRIRSIANASEGRICSYPGSPGYKLMTAITVKESTAILTVMSQVKKMEKRFREMMACYHRQVGGSPSTDHSPN